MNELEKPKEMVQLEKYLKNQGRTDFIQGVLSMSREQLDEKLLALAKYREAITDTMQLDEDLRKAGDLLKALRGPYNEDKRMNAKLARYVSLVAQEKGFK